MSGVFMWLILLLCALYWLRIVIGRLPGDLRTIRDRWSDFRATYDPVQQAIYGDPVKLYQKRAEAWRELLIDAGMQIFFFWPVTVLIVILLIRFLLTAADNLDPLISSF